MTYNSKWPLMGESFNIIEVGSNSLSEKKRIFSSFSYFICIIEHDVLPHFVLRLRLEIAGLMIFGSCFYSSLIISSQSNYRTRRDSTPPLLYLGRVKMDY